MRVVAALLSGGRLALTHLGRHRREQAFVKHHFQANTEQRRPVLSTVFLSEQMWRNHRFRVTRSELFRAGFEGAP